MSTSTGTALEVEIMTKNNPTGLWVCLRVLIFTLKLLVIFISMPESDVRNPAQKIINAVSLLIRFEKQYSFTILIVKNTKYQYTGLYI